MISLIIMAAGSSKRFSYNGQWENKLLRPLGNLSVVERCLITVRQAADRLCEEDLAPKVFLVTRYQEILDLAEKYDFHGLYCEESEKGVSYSIRCGLAACASSSEAAIFIAADQPLLTSRSILRLVHTFQTSGKGIVSLGDEHCPGNPVLFSNRYFEELMHLSGDRGGRRVANAHKEDLEYVSPDSPCELWDCDTEEAFLQMANFV